LTDLVVRKIPWALDASVPDPADQPVPDSADTWMREYDRGTDMTRFFGSSGTPER
jgi:hypothetical protein